MFGGGFDRLTAESGFFPRLKKAFGVLCTIVGIYLLARLSRRSRSHLAAGAIGREVSVPAMQQHIEKIPWNTDLNAVAGVSTHRGEAGPDRHLGDVVRQLPQVGRAHLVG